MPKQNISKKIEMKKKNKNNSRKKKKRQSFKGGVEEDLLAENKNIPEDKKIDDDVMSPPPIGAPPAYDKTGDDEETSDGGDNEETGDGGDDKQTDGGSDNKETDGGGDDQETSDGGDAGDNKETDDGGDDKQTDGGSDNKETDGGSDNKETDGGSDNKETDGGGDDKQTDGGGMHDIMLPPPPSIDNMNSSQPASPENMAPLPATLPEDAMDSKSNDFTLGVPLNANTEDPLTDNTEVVKIKDDKQSYLKLFQLIFGHFKEDDQFQSVTDLNYMSNDKVIGEDMNSNNFLTRLKSIDFTPEDGNDEIKLDNLNIPGPGMSIPYHLKVKEYASNTGNILVDDDNHLLGLNLSDYPRWAMVDVMAARPPDSAFDGNLLKSIKSWSANKIRKEFRTVFRPVRLVFIAGVFQERQSRKTTATTATPFIRGNICGDSIDDILREVKAGGGLCFSYAIIRDDNGIKKLKFMNSKVIRYMFCDQPMFNKTNDEPGKIGICTMDDTPCGGGVGVPYRGGARTVSNQGFTFLYKSGDTASQSFPEMEFIQMQEGERAISNQTLKTSRDVGSSPFKAHSFFMNLVRTYIINKSLTPESLDMESKVKKGYLQFLRGMTKMLPGSADTSRSEDNEKIPVNTVEEGGGAPDTVEGEKVLTGSNITLPVASPVSKNNIPIAEPVL
jgi:hypothetical protein